MIRPPPSTTLFPYTTLSRSDEFCPSWDDNNVRWLAHRHCRESGSRTGGEILWPEAMTSRQHQLCRHDVFSQRRSEEHTSELQSQSNLVCRLLLEKKKYHIQC